VLPCLAIRVTGRSPLCFPANVLASIRTSGRSGFILINPERACSLGRPELRARGVRGAGAGIATTVVIFSQRSGSKDIYSASIWYLVRFHATSLEY
jgi:hypothetical protein